MDLGLEKKVVVITGGSRGIGAGTARILSGEGASVIICSRDQKMLRQTARGINAATGNEVFPVPADLTLPEDITHLVETVIDKYGQIDTLVNNAAAPFLVISMKLLTMIGCQALISSSSAT